MKLFEINGNIFIKDDTVILRGQATTEDIDKEKEIILRDAINFEPLLKYGYITFEHNPFNIVGIPIRAEVNEKGLFIEAKLFKDNPIVQKLLELDKSLKSLDQKHLKWRGIKLSVEGYPRERKGNKITKADIINVAITFYPVNPNTTAQLLEKAFSFQNFVKSYLCQHKSECSCGKINPISERIMKSMVAGYQTNPLMMRDGEALRRQSHEGIHYLTPEALLYILTTKGKKATPNIAKYLKSMLNKGVHPSIAISILATLYNYNRNKI